MVNPIVGEEYDDISTELAAYVPYTGATADVDLGANSLTANQLIVNGTTSPGLNIVRTYPTRVVPCYEAYIYQTLAWTGTGGTLGNSYFRTDDQRTLSQLTTTDTFSGLEVFLSRANLISAAGTHNLRVFPLSLYDLGNYTRISSNQRVNNYIFDGILSLSPNIDCTGTTFTYNNYGYRLTVGYNPDTADMTAALASTTYGFALVADSFSNTTGSTYYGLFNDVDGFESNWFLYNSSAANNWLGEDNSKAYFGTDKDASIYYDGTNLVINPKDVGTGSLSVGGNVGIGTTNPDAKLDVLSTTEQLRLSYTDGSVYTSFTTDSTGDLTIAPTGGDTKLTGKLSTTQTTSNTSASQLVSTSLLYYGGTGSGNTANSLYALYFSAETVAAYDGNITTGIFGVSGVVNHYGSGTITNAYGQKSQVILRSGAGAITNAYGQYIGECLDQSAVGSITNAYGLYISHQNDATTLNYAIYTNDGLVRFGDDVSVDGNLTMNGNTFRVKKVNGGGFAYFDSYDTNTVNYSFFGFRKSHSETETVTTTVDTEPLGAIVFYGVDSGNNFDVGAQIHAIQDGAAGTRVPTKLRFNTASSSAVNSDVLVLNTDASAVFSGNVGIGTTSPDTKLQVVGDVRVGEDTTNYTNFDSTGHQTMSGTARPWRDELTDAVNIRGVGTGVSTNSSEGTQDFTTAANLSDYLYLNIQLNHDKDLTSSIYPHIHWFQAEANVPNFLLQYRWQINGGAKVTSWTNLKCNTAVVTYTSGTINQICYASPISVPVGTTLSDIVQFRILRDNADTSGEFGASDNYSTTVGVLAFDCHFMISSIGSTDEYTK
jgi:hypothetical protein